MLLQRLFLTTFLLLLSACGNEANDFEAKDHELRINHLQNIGTHNSYHSAPLGEPVISVIERRYKWFDRKHYMYFFDTLTVQLKDQGIRHFELDVYADPEGGKFNHSPINARAKLPVERNIPELEEPGFKVLHIPQLDPNSTCWTLIACLQEIRAWSDNHPHHQPILIIIEIKDVDFLQAAPHLKFTRFTDEDFAALEEEILSIFPRERIITPDDVQGGHATLEEAVLTTGWPTLAESRGKLIFSQYHGRTRPDTRGKLFFPQSRPGTPNAAIVIIDEFEKDSAHIREWVEQGYLVRVRTGSPQEAVNNDYTIFKKALSDGVHFISTDSPVPNALNPEYVTVIPNGVPARCNPVTAPAGCRSEDIEDPERL